MKKTFCFHKKRCAFLSHKLCLYKRLGVLIKKEKEMFTRELASIENLERSEHGVSESVRPSNVIKVVELMTNPFKGLLDLFSF